MSSLKRTRGGKKMNITQEARVLDLYQKTTIEIQPGELK